jgi:Homeodomain-like domain-containing protein
MSRQTTPQVAGRRARVVELRRDRWTWDAIGDDLGVSRQRVRQIYDEALNEVTAAQVTEHRHEEGELVDRAVRELLCIAEDPDVSPRTRVEAWNSIRGWSEYRSKLYGLFAPSKSSVEVLTKDAFTADMERMAVELESTN